MRMIFLSLSSRRNEWNNLGTYWDVPNAQYVRWNMRIVPAYLITKRQPTKRSHYRRFTLHFLLIRVQSVVCKSVNLIWRVVAAHVAPRAAKSN